LIRLLSPTLAVGEEYKAWVYTQLPAAPEGICVDSKGNLFATMIRTNEVVRLNSAGTYEHVAWVPKKGAGGLTIGIEADTQDNLYVAFKWHDDSFQLNDPRHPDCMDINDTTTGVYRIDAETREVTPVATRGDGWKMCFPDDVDIDDEGNVYVSDLTYAGIWKITPDGKAAMWCDHQLLNWEHWYPSPLGINVLVLDDEQENIYFATSSGSASLVGKVPIKEHGTAGEPVIVSRGHASFDGIEIDEEEYLYLSELSNDEIVVIDPLSTNPLGPDLPPRLHIANKATAPLDGPCSLVLRDGILYSTQLGWGNPNPDKTIVAIQGLLKPSWGRKE